MPGTNFLFTLIGLVLAIFAICKMDSGTPTVENWWNGPGFTVKAIPGRCTKNGPVAIGGNYLNPNTLGSDKFFQVANFQGVLSPRAASMNYGANIRYNMPDRKNLATPCNPLGFGDMVSNDTKENYGCNSNSTVSCGKGGYGMGNKVAGGYELPSNYSNGNWEQVYDSIPGQPTGDSDNLGCGPHPLDNADLPIGTMDTMDSAGNLDQIVPFNRIMYANKMSRLRQHGDMIRGDLAIAPCTNTQWFNVNPNINVDLQAGAMNVMGGANAGNSDLLKLMVQASGGTVSTFGGVNLREELTNENVNMANQSITDLSAALGDVQVTSYP